MAKQKKTTALNYPQVTLVPKPCVLKSRKEADTRVTIGNHSFDLPIIPANMSSIINEQLAQQLAEHNIFYIMHRFNIDTTQFITNMKNNNLPASISVGIKPEDYKLVVELADKNLDPDYITIDIAHGHSETVSNMIHHIEMNLPETFIIAGNVGTADAVQYLERAGADAIKIGVAPGKACTTFMETGFGTRGWQLTAIEECSNAAKHALIIADGGIRMNGDIAKSIAFGADMVMVGSMLAGHDENPGDIITINGEKKKLYYGSASATQKNNTHNIEGKTIEVSYKGSIWDSIQGMKESLQSSISYAGGRSLKDLWNVEYVIADNIES